MDRNRWSDSTETGGRIAPKRAAKEPMLWIKAAFQVNLDETSEYLAVQQSVFALVVDDRTQRPVIRLEFERGGGNEPDDDTPGRHSRPAAHVQIHGASEELAYVQGLNHQTKLRGLENFHIPVGGRRFRPSLEDFIEFLHAERLIPQPNDGWQEVHGCRSGRSRNCRSAAHLDGLPRGEADVLVASWGMRLGTRTN
jgi:hypothetical protein